eukprot:6199120-Pyramimonas_sp.AAC.1
MPASPGGADTLAHAASIEPPSKTDGCEPAQAIALPAHISLLVAGDSGLAERPPARRKVLSMRPPPRRSQA